MDESDSELPPLRPLPPRELKELTPKPSEEADTEENPAEKNPGDVPGANSEGAPPAGLELSVSSAGNLETLPDDTSGEGVNPDELDEVPGPTRPRCDDRFSPVLVMELRQAVRSRFVVFAMCMVLLALLIGAWWLLFIARPMTSGSREFGPEFFQGIFSVYFFGCYFFIPLYTAIRLDAARSSAGMELIAITDLTASNIIAGKLKAGMVLAMMMMGLSLPFMTLSFLLRGIDLLTIFAIAMFAFVMFFGGTYWVLFWSSIPGPVMMRIVLYIIAIGGLLVSGIGFFAGTISIQQTGILELLGTPGFWYLMFILGIMWGFGNFIAHSVSVTSIQTNADRRAVMNEFYEMT